MCEPPEVLASLGDDVSEIAMPHARGSDFVGPLVHIASDQTRPELLALTGPHGRWIEWVADASPGLDATVSPAGR